MDQSQAEKQIAQILCQLETEQGVVIDRVTLRDIEVTGFEDKAPQYQRHVCIETHRLPGHNWGDLE